MELNEDEELMSKFHNMTFKAVKTFKGASGIDVIPDPAQRLRLHEQLDDIVRRQDRLIKNLILLAGGEY